MNLYNLSRGSGNNQHEISGIDKVLNGIEQLTSLIGNQHNDLQQVKRDVSEVKSDYKELSNRVGTIESTQTVGRIEKKRMEKAKNIAVHRELDKYLNFKYDENGNLTPESYKKKRKYSRRFCRKFWTDAEKNAHCGFPYEETLRRDCDEVVDYANRWVPDFTYNGMYGTQAFIAYIDACGD